RLQAVGHPGTSYPEPPRAGSPGTKDPVSTVRTGPGRSRLVLQHPVPLAAFGLEPVQQLEVDLADPLRGDRLGGVDLLHLHARRVLVEVLPGEAAALVVGPDERLPARHVVELVVVRDG